MNSVRQKLHSFPQTHTHTPTHTLTYTHTHTNNAGLYYDDQLKQLCLMSQFLMSYGHGYLQHLNNIFFFYFWSLHSTCEYRTDTELALQSISRCVSLSQNQATRLAVLNQAVDNEFSPRLKNNLVRVSSLLELSCCWAAKCIISCFILGLVQVRLAAVIHQCWTHMKFIFLLTRFSCVLTVI